MTTTPDPAKYAPLEGLFIARKPDRDGDYLITNADGKRVVFITGWEINNGRVVIPPAPRPPRLGPLGLDGVPLSEASTKAWSCATFGNLDEPVLIRRILDCRDLVAKWDAEDNA